jgi:hypothetical protein
MSNNIHCIVDGILKDGFISTDKGSGHLDEFSAIPLTEKILMEWCGFKSMNDSMGFRLQLDKEIAFRVYLANDNDGNEVWSHNNCDIFQRDSSDDFHQVCLNVIPLYLHQLQMLVLALKNQPLKIELK